MAKDDTPTLKVKMLNDVYGSPDGKTRKRYKANQEYILPDHLFNSFKDMGAVELVEEKSVSGAPENKAIQGAPENKAEVRHRGGRWYDVVFGGEQMNDKAMDKESAEELAKEMNNGG